MDRRDSEGSFSTRLVGRFSDSSYNTAINEDVCYSIILVPKEVLVIMVLEGKCSSPSSYGSTGLLPQLPVLP